ncbi:MAG: trypsin-like serine protease [Mesorhizobium sp.]|uniref:trypsin-like serine peptidase n=1 Tax=Mesorhizobium sp. TaxID=1871066 RepID=UPI001202C9B9|nr:trypsin-like peptidase domain-containing protein [Mesorhizobium sp.]TIR25961.1 MAG: trypsin-like serine protease [Mesorhizobium sp.]
MKDFHRICAALGLCFAGSSSQLYATESSAPASRRESVSPASDYFTLAKMVGQLSLELPDDSGGSTVTAVCSALAISTKYIITARHCFYDQAGGDVGYIRSYVWMAHTDGAKKVYELKHAFAEESEQNDFVIIESKEPIAEFSGASLKLPDSPVGAGEDLFMLHFPGPGSLVLTRLDCKTSDPGIADTKIHHTCDTDSGSSGAPIFDGKFDFVGMHQAGGRGSDPKSFNTGLAVGALLSASPIFAGAVSAPQVNPAVVPVAALEYEYDSSIGASFIKQGQDWYWRSGDEPMTVLVAQHSVPNMFTFWDPTRDLLVRWPEPGGDLTSKGASKAAAPFVKIGQVVKKHGPNQ